MKDFDLVGFYDNLKVEFAGQNKEFLEEAAKNVEKLLLENLERKKEAQFLLPICLGYIAITKELIERP